MKESRLLDTSMWMIVDTKTLLCVILNLPVAHVEQSLRRLAWQTFRRSQ